MNDISNTTKIILSPMNPPGAYDPPHKESISVDEMHPFIQEFVKDHEAIKAALDRFEDSVLSMKENGISSECNAALRDFFEFMSEFFIAHDKREEKDLFPSLSKKLIEKGEYSQGPNPTTAVDVMEDDHLKVIQLIAVIFNFFALSSQLKDPVSRHLVLDTAIEQSYQLIELLRLHIFREDTIIFPLAHQLMGVQELNRLREQKRVK